MRGCVCKKTSAVISRSKPPPPKPSKNMTGKKNICSVKTTASVTSGNGKETRTWKSAVRLVNKEWPSGVFPVISLY